MSLKLGNTGINKLYLGSGEVKKAYLGSTLVFDNGVVPLYDNVSAMYTLRQPPMTTLWDKEVLKLRRSSDNDQRFVFFDDDGKISLASSVSGAGDLLAWIGSNDAFVTEWIGIDGTNTITASKTAIQTTTSKQPQFISSGVIITKNSEPTIDFLSSERFLQASVNTDLNHSSEFTVLGVGNNNAIEAGGILHTNSSGNDRFSLYLDTSSSKYIANYRLAYIGYLATQASTTQRLVSTVSGGAVFTSTYYNGIIQDTGGGSGNYSNNYFVIGRGFYSIQYLNGTIQEITIFPSDKTADLTELHTEINDYYTIY